MSNLSALSRYTLARSTRTPPVSELAPSLDLRHLPADATFLRILGVNYVHIKTADDSDLYLTEHGLPLIDHLRPENWYEREWFLAKRERLQGTSTVYRVPTKHIANSLPHSIDLVVKWSRVGEDVPLDTFTLNKTINAEFNTPFEEFNLLEELRSGRYWPAKHRILTQRPLAIFVPPERMQLWQTGRSKSKISQKIARHPGVEIDILRSYVLLYQWIDGFNAFEAYTSLYYDAAKQQEEIQALTMKVNQELEENGFTVADNKPTHVIVRMENGHIVRRRNGKVAYALIDYELLARTPEHEDTVRQAMRSKYLTMQRERFHPTDAPPFPSHLRPAKLDGVDFIHGRTESTNGALWVVGKNPELFNYFLPERWRSKQIQLSKTGLTYYTQTKDRIHLVWKVSRVGELPPGDLADPGYERLLLQGYNSPFEEFALALEMQSKGIRTTYPRAIYMTGQENELLGRIIDDRRFSLYQHVLGPDNQPVLRIDRDYITIWGYWRGLDDQEAASESGYWQPVDVWSAASKGIITRQLHDELLVRHAAGLAAAGYRDTNLRGDHVLLSYIPDGSLKRDKEGNPELRQCNFEMVVRL